jgi:hypothetical protein
VQNRNMYVYTCMGLYHIPLIKNSMYMCTYIHTYIHIKQAPREAETHTRRVCVYIYIYIYIYIHTHIHILTYMYIHTQPPQEATQAREKPMVKEREALAASSSINSNPPVGTNINSNKPANVRGSGKSLEEPVGANINSNKPANVRGSGKSLEELCKSHNKQFRPKPAYEPPKHAVKDIRYVCVCVYLYIYI